MGHSGSLLQLLLVIAIAAVGAAAFGRLRLPPIVGFLAMGALAGPGGLGLVRDAESVRAVAELGVVFLLFEVGLELPLERVQRLWGDALRAGGLQVAITLLGAAGIARAFGVDWSGAWVMGALVAMSSTALVMGLLSERGEVDAPHGRLSLGILLFQDLCIVPFLLAVSVLSSAGSAAGAAWATARGVLALALLFGAARFGLPRLLDRLARAPSREAFTLVAFLAVLGSAVAAEALGLTLAVGAFIGGLALSATPYTHQLLAEVMPLRGVLLGIFFTAVGMLVDVPEAVRDAAPVAVYVASIVVLKAGVVIAVVALLLRRGSRVAILTGLGLAQTGEFSFVLAAASADAGLLSRELQQIFITGSVLSLAATPFLVRAGPHIAQGVVRVVGAASREPARADAPVAGHVVLIGFGSAGRTLARVMRARSLAYVAVDSNPRHAQEAQERGEPVLYGDATSPRLLERLGVRHARMVVVAISDPVATKQVVATLHALAPDVEVVARTRYVIEVDALERAGARVVVAEEFESTLELLARVLRGFGVPDGAIARFGAELRVEGYELLRAPPQMILDPWLAELLDETESTWLEVPPLAAELTLASLAVRAHTGATVLAITRGGTTTPNPPPDAAVRGGDRLLVLGAPRHLEALRALLWRHAEPDAPKPPGDG